MFALGWEYPPKPKVNPVLIYEDTGEIVKKTKTIEVDF